MDNAEQRHATRDLPRPGFWNGHCTVAERDRVEAEDVLQIAYLKVLDGRALAIRWQSHPFPPGYSASFALPRPTSDDDRILRFVQHVRVKLTMLPFAGDHGGAVEGE